ncbi:hypothetical protein KUTeg_012699 [Tegillarca granosa]|uniref:Carboxylic ester hydrolase n=1 Tax=Tegillarca granosa TaxID=220873 RepID=A0ABQ9F0A4_TEGGR|nr:hypothetical protein KUTeg_012699 [Tegillarca granosa]
MMYCRIIFLSLLACTSYTVCQEYKTVSTCSGPVKGIVEYRGNEKIYNFRGIPYAKPPIGDLRFRKPEPIESWVNVLDATRFGAPCVQSQLFGNVFYGGSVSEDCLYLNIYVPNNISMTNKMAVMVWIHGGGYSQGEGASYDGGNLAIKGDVIVVTFNYRLGIFGFLNTNDNESPGNFGLWDQNMVFQWVKSNIEAFGGNPSAITIFGESAGGMSVSYHTLIPYNKGLFQRAIAQSGTAFSSPVPTASKNKDFINFINGKLNCTSSTQFNTSEFVQCLKRKSYTELNNVGSGYMNIETGTLQGIPVAPSIDGDLITTDPDVLLSDKTSYAYNFFRSLDYMAGTTDGEASIFLTVLSLLESMKVININLTEGISKEFLCETFSQDMAKSYFKNSPKAAKALCDKYSYHGNEDKLIQQGILVADMSTDLYFIGPTVKTLKIHEDKNTERKTYHYFFSRAIPEIFGMVSPPWFTKASHGTELAFIFGGSAFNNDLF